MSKVKIILMGVIVALLCVVVWLALDRHSTMERTAESVVSRAFAPLVQQFPIMQFGTLSEPVTVLFMGTDVVYDHKQRSAHPEPGSYRGNSDSMMCVRLDPANDRVVVIQIPRDTEVTIGGRVRKINSANPMGGPTLAEKTVSDLLGTPIDHYTIMNVHGLVDLIDEIGGITVKVPKRMEYMDWTAKLKIDLSPGYHTLTGNQAMGFVRFRHDALGDIGRLQRQQIFMDACFRKLMDPGSWLHAPALIDIAQKNIDTDIEAGDIVKMAGFVHSVPKANVIKVVLPGRFAGNGDWVANADVKNMVARLLDPSQDTAACRRNISICVQNGTSDRSQGWKLAVALRKLGYLVSLGGMSDEPVTQTKIIAQNGNRADATMIQQDLGNIGEVVNASIGNIATSITIIAGSDIMLDKICRSCPDAPYVTPPPPPPQPVAAAPPPASANTDEPTEPEGVSAGDAAPMSADQNPLDATGNSTGAGDVPGSTAKSDGNSTLDASVDDPNQKAAAQAAAKEFDGSVPLEPAGSSAGEAAPSRAAAERNEAPVENQALPNSGDSLPVKNEQRRSDP